MQFIQQVKGSSAFRSRWGRIVLLVLCGSVLVQLFFRIPSTDRVGKNDLIGYWSATYLFRHNVNPYDLQAMDRLQHDGMKTGKDYTIMAWNPPTLFVFLLPLSWLSFDAARSVLLLVNLAIVSASTWMLARIYLPGAGSNFALKCLFFSFTFPPVLLGFYMGQITFLALISLVGCVLLIQRGNWFWAGAVLILSTVKPHLVILSVIYLLLYMLKHRHLRALLGLAFSGISCILILTIFRSVWIHDLLSLVAVAPTNWTTPTIGGLLSYLHITEAGRSALIVFLPLPFILMKYENLISLETAVALLTLITVPATFFGWSYDQTILIIPIVQVFAWMSGSEKRSMKTSLIVATGIALLLNYYQRMVNTNEVFYWWVPFFVLALYIFAWLMFRPAPDLKQQALA